MAILANESGSLKNLTGIYGYDFSGVASWSEGSDEDITKMVQASDAGALDLSLFWSVGDERLVTLSAMAATGVGESHVSQEVAFVLMHNGGVILTNGKSCGFVVGLRECLLENGYMNSSGTNAGSWKSCARRQWCNSVFYNSIPSAIKALFKPFRCITATEYNASSVTTTDDYFALPAEKEIFGSRSYSNQTEANSLFQFNFYKTAANRIKHFGLTGTSGIYWWGRSPYNSGTGGFCSVSGNGGASNYNASSTNGLAPFGAI